MSDTFISLTKTINQYQVHAEVPQTKNVLSIEVSSPTEPFTWHGTFSSQYIEDLTIKTGHKKSFFEFLNVLDQALTSALSYSYVDILTFNDLKGIRGSSAQAKKPDFEQIIKNNKRYLILSTSNGTDDKVHYPLSLGCEPISQIESLFEIIRNLQTELTSKQNSSDLEGNSNSTCNSSIGFDKQSSKNSTQMNGKKDLAAQSIDQLKLENELLKAKVKRVEDYFSQKQGAVEIEQLVQQRLSAENDLDRIRLTSAKRICELEVEVELKERQLAAKKAENFELQKELTKTVCDSEDASSTRVKAQLLKLSEESEASIVQAKKTIAKQKEEIQNLTDAADRALAGEKKLKQRIANLEIELSNAQRRSTSKSNPLGYGQSGRLNQGSSPVSSQKRNSYHSPNNNHPRKLGYSSPTLQANMNRGRLIDSSSPNLSKQNSANSQKSSVSNTSLRSNSIGTPKTIITNNNISVRSRNSLTDASRPNKFFGQSDTPSPLARNSANGTQNNSSSNRSISRYKQEQLQRQQKSQQQEMLLQQQRNMRKPLHVINALSEQQKRNQSIDASISSKNSADIYTIPEKGKIRSQYQQQRLSIQEPSSRTPSIQSIRQAVINNSQRDTASQRNSSASVSYKENIPQPRTAPTINPTQPRIGTGNSYKPTPKNNSTTLPERAKQSRIISNNYIHAPDFTEKTEATQFDDKHITNDRSTSELEIKINKIQNILQSSKQITIEDF